MAPEPFRRSASPVIRRSMAERNAHNVLPEPVGATTRALPPAWMTGHAWLCAAVGTSNACLNHALVGPENRFKHSYIYSIMRCSLDPRHTARRRATYSSTHSSTSPGWHSSASQMPSSVEKRMALARPFFSTETFAGVMPTRSASPPPTFCVWRASRRGSLGSPCQITTSSSSCWAMAASTTSA